MAGLADPVALAVVARVEIGLTGQPDLTDCPGTIEAGVAAAETAENLAQMVEEAVAQKAGPEK